MNKENENGLKTFMREIPTRNFHPTHWK